MYPQRSILMGPLYTKGGTGSIPSGKINGKMIVIECLMDEIAYPWQADWYRSKIKEHLGEQFDDNYRLWYIDHAMHTPPIATPLDPPPSIHTRIINYGPVLQQALRDVSAWVEKGIKPPLSTTYKIVDGQVEVPPTAAERKGVQPVINLTVNGGERADVKVGEKVKFNAVIETPPDAGSVVGVEWDFEGEGDFPITSKLKDTKSTHVEVTTKYAFSKAGTYFPAARASSHRQGNPNTPYARIPNLGRVRVVVTSGDKGKSKDKDTSEEKEKIFELKEKPADLGKITNNFFDAIAQHKTIAQGREFSNNEVGSRTEISTKFEVVPAPGSVFYTISFEEIDSGIGIFIKIDFEISGSFKMMAKMIKKATSKMIIETTVEILNEVLKETE
ncbi:MAG: hypothetical protein ACFFBP_07770 [Promethearchaeota archaeon]